MYDDQNRVSFSHSFKSHRNELNKSNETKNKFQLYFHFNAHKDSKFIVEAKWKLKETKGTYQNDIN